MRRVREHHVRFLKVVIALIALAHPRANVFAIAVECFWLFMTWRAMGLPRATPMPAPRPQAAVHPDATIDCRTSAIA